MRTMRSVFGLLVMAVSVGCGPNPNPVPGGGGRTCSQLGWYCGFDDFGQSCGSCGGGQTCNGGGRCTTGSTCSCAARECGLDSCGVASCGSCGAGRMCSAGVCAAPPPSLHEIASGRPPLFSGYYGIPFTLPTTALVAYAAQSTSGDTFSVGIFDESNWAVFRTGGTGARAWAPHSSTSIASDTTTLSAGTYYLGFYCTNVIQRCQLGYAINATY